MPRIASEQEKTNVRLFRNGDKRVRIHPAIKKLYNLPFIMKIKKRKVARQKQKGMSVLEMALRLGLR